MAYERMEREFPCLCGNGKMIAEWEEHDTYPSSNRCLRWHFDCPACATEYVFYSPTSTPSIVRRAEAEIHRAISEEYRSARRRVLKLAVPRYEQKWVEYVFSLPTKTAKCDAIVNCSYSTFLKRAHSPHWLEEQARSAFKFRFERCLDRLEIEDAEISELIAAARAAESAADALWKNIEKEPLPFE